MAAFIGVHPFAGVVGVGVAIIPPAAAGLVSDRPGISAATPDSINDSLGISVTRGATQVTIGITGFAQHHNPGATGHGVSISRLRVAVYPDTTSAKNGTNEIASGQMTFFGSDKTVLAGFFNPGDFTGPTTIGDGNDYQVSTTPGLSKVVTVPNGNTAIVQVKVDPEAGATTPASSPPTLVLLASLLLGVGTWVMIRRRSALA